MECVGNQNDERAIQAIALEKCSYPLQPLGLFQFELCPGDPGCGAESGTSAGSRTRIVSCGVEHFDFYLPSWRRTLRNTNSSAKAHSAWERVCRAAGRQNDGIRTTAEWLELSGYGEACDR